MTNLDKIKKEKIKVKEKKHTHIWPIVTYTPDQAVCEVCGLSYWGWEDNYYNIRRKELERQRKIYNCEKNTEN